MKLSYICCGKKFPLNFSEENEMRKKLRKSVLVDRYEKAREQYSRAFYINKYKEVKRYV